MTTERRTLPTDTSPGMLLIISGPSGVGKTTITRAVERSIAGSVFSVSATTRPITNADVDGVDYHFISRQHFDELEAQNAFLETAEVFGNKYGTPKAWVEEQLARGRLVILEIDVVGAIQVKQSLPDLFAVFVLPPDEHTLLDRLRNRKREPEEVIQRRFAEAKKEIEHARSASVYNLFLVNDNLDDAIARAIAAVNNEWTRRKQKTQPQIPDA